MKFTVEQCNHLIETAELKNEWGRFRGGKGTSYYTDVIPIESDSVKELIAYYCIKNFNIKVDPIKICIIKYLKGDLIERHIDVEPGNAYNGSLIESNYFNVNIRLNDSFKGGQFYLDDKPYTKSVGEIYHYKSEVYHEVKKITEGVRYIALYTIPYSKIISNKHLL